MAEQHIVSLILMEPLSKLFGHPSEGAGQIYYEALAGYDEDELRGAFTWLRDHHKYSRFPKISDIHAAKDKGIKRNLKAVGSPGHSEGGETPWDRLDKDRKQMVKDYMVHFTGYSSIYTESLRGKWSKQLLRFIEAVAWVQAQVILRGGCGVNYGKEIFPDGLEYDQKKAHLYQTMDRAKMSSQIDVAVPTSMIAMWEREVAYEDRQIRRMTSAPKEETPTKPMSEVLETISEKQEVENNQAEDYDEKYEETAESLLEEIP